MGTHWRKILQTKHLSSADIDGSVDVKIIKVTQKEVEDGQGGSKSMPVAELEGMKPIALNVTNCKTLQKLSKSSEIEKWAGMTVTLVTSRVKAFGEVVDAIRIAPVLPSPKQDNSSMIAAIESCKSEDGLRALWSGLEKSVQNDPAVIAAKDAMKEKLSKGA